mmetsp:Transcript_87687/g.277203  ORF Transcript_87687/g.277203 Transcript_87687/m.277203 type:complete len:340 (+) Transcript_87687:575-1594(+)
MPRSCENWLSICSHKWQPVDLVLARIGMLSADRTHHQAWMLVKQKDPIQILAVQDKEQVCLVVEKLFQGLMELECPGQLDGRVNRADEDQRSPEAAGAGVSKLAEPVKAPTILLDVARVIKYVVEEPAMSSAVAGSIVGYTVETEEVSKVTAQRRQQSLHRDSDPVKRQRRTPKRHATQGSLHSAPGTQRHNDAWDMVRWARHGQLHGGASSHPVGPWHTAGLPVRSARTAKPVRLFQGCPGSARASAGTLRRSRGKGRRREIKPSSAVCELPTCAAGHQATWGGGLHPMHRGGLTPAQVSRPQAPRAREARRRRAVLAPHRHAHPALRAKSSRGLPRI